MTRKNGVAYIAFSNMSRHQNLGKMYYVDGAKDSSLSIKKIHPNLHITLMTDFDSNYNYGDSFDYIENIVPKGIRVKQDYLILSQYENTLYLDSDTRVVNDIMDVFRIMEKFDIAATFDYVRSSEERNKIWVKYYLIPESFSEFCGGVFLFKKSDKIKKFFEVWKNNYEEWVRLSGTLNDQPSFRVSLWQCEDLRLFVLPQEFNLRTQSKVDSIKKRYPIKDRIYHWHKTNKERKPQGF